MSDHTTLHNVCAHCGKEFPVYPSRPDRLFCSRACYYAAHAAPLITTTCKACGKDFQIKKSYEGRYTFCSDECRNADRQPRLCGVYAIECLANGTLYIGSSVHIYRRWRGHRSKLKSGTHENPYLQKDYDLFGSDMFSYTILGYAEKSGLRDLEQIFLDGIIGRGTSYNVHPNAETALGRTFTAEQRTRVSNRNKGRIITAEHRRKLSKALKGRTFSEEHRRNLSGSKKRRPPAQLP